MLVSGHLPYRHDNLRVGAMPGVHNDGTKPHPLFAGSVGGEGGRGRGKGGGGREEGEGEGRKTREE